MHKNFVTLFNSAYLTRGLLMFESLLATGKNFTLYVVAFDDVTFRFLKEKAHPNLIPVSLEEFEDAELLKVKPGRTPAEYCWTCTPSTIKYCIEKFRLDHCVYIDADLFFYSDPQVLFDEWGQKDVLITEHRYTKEYDQSALNGIYCVQFTGFKNTPAGMKALNWWRDACIDWCFAYAENGKFGDQKYLDDWTTRFEGVHVLKHLGGGLAPWNIQQYSFSGSSDAPRGKELATGKEFDAVFFHYHGLKFYTDGIVSLSYPYTIEPEKKKLFFFNYVFMLEALRHEILPKTGTHNVNGAVEGSPEKPVKNNFVHRLLSSKETRREENFHFYYLKDILGQ